MELLGMPTDLTVYKLLTDWGSFIGGILALIAGGVAYIGARRAAAMQVEADRQKEDREVEALRKSLATEVRQLVVQALGVHDGLKKLSETTGPITAWMVESYSRISNAVVFPGSASKIGLLDGDAMDVVIVYNLIEIARDGAARLMRYRTPDDITPKNVAAVADAFLQACMYARGVPPKLKTGVPLHDQTDAALLNEINKRQAARVS
jgi:hypothetical protein